MGGRVSQRNIINELKIRTMKLKTTLVSLIGAMVIGTTGYVGYQTYEKNKAANESDLFLENIEALANNESYKGWEVISSPCPYQIDYKNSVTCKRFGDADDCVPSDC